MEVLKTWIKDGHYKRVVNLTLSGMVYKPPPHLVIYDYGPYLEVRTRTGVRIKLLNRVRFVLAGKPLSERQGFKQINL